MRILMWSLMMLVFVTAAYPAAAQSARTETIAAVVNEDAVSESDLEARLKMVIASSKLPNNREIREKLTPQILSVLIEEKLKLQEARRLEIDIQSEEIDAGFAAIAGQNKFTPEQFRGVLSREGVSVKTLRDQIEAEIAWSKEQAF